MRLKLTNYTLPELMIMHNYYQSLIAEAIKLEPSSQNADLIECYTVLNTRIETEIYDNMPIFHF